MKKILVIYAHPNYAHAKINQALIEKIKNLNQVTVHNLYEYYPHEKLDVKYEQQLLLEHDLIIFQFPFSWYSVTPLLKKWIDEVLTVGFAYGLNGDKLHGKSLMLCTTTSGSANNYTHEQLGITLNELLKPIEYTAKYCGLIYRPPILIANPPEEDHKLKEQIQAYVKLLDNYIISGDSVFDTMW